MLQFRTRILILFTLTSFYSNTAHSLGNHPESTACPPEKPYYAFCTHALHSLEGWYGHCHATQEEAQLEADQHAKEHHNGNSRWTGVLKVKFKSSGY